jgi:hypothetical protein
MFCSPRCSHLSTILNNIVESESGVTILFNIVQYCWQLWTMWAAKHCSILFSSILQQPDRFLPCRLYYLYNNYDINFLTVFILTHLVNFPCARKPEHPEKTHDFRQSVDWLFSHESVARIEPTISEVNCACSDDCATLQPLWTGEPG